MTRIRRLGTFGATARRQAFAAITVILTSAALFPAHVSAAPSSITLEWVWQSTMNESGFRNWDYHPERSSDLDKKQASFPVNLLFTNGASINFIKDNLATKGWQTTGSCDVAYMVPYDGAGFYTWDTDCGKKKGNDGPNNYYSHYREYADPSSDENGYTLDWGMWTYATSHLDVQENTEDEQFGFNNTARDEIAAGAAQVWAASPKNGTIFVNNAIVEYEPRGATGAAPSWVTTTRRTALHGASMSRSLRQRRL